MKAKDVRNKLTQELQAQFSNADASLFAPGEPVINFPSPSFDKPKMFEPIKHYKGSEGSTDSFNIKGIAFGDKNGEQKLENNEVYNMQELIASNPENMSTILYDEKVLQTQLALVKKRDWYDMLFSDVDLFKPIDFGMSVKKLFKRG